MKGYMKLGNEGIRTLRGHGEVFVEEEDPNKEAKHGQVPALGALAWDQNKGMETAGEEKENIEILLWGIKIINYDWGRKHLRFRFY